MAQTHPSPPYLWQLWLARSDDLHGCDKDEKERKRLEKLQPRVLAFVRVLQTGSTPSLRQAKANLRTPQHPRTNETPEQRNRNLVRLVTPTVERALADAAQ